MKRTACFIATLLLVSTALFANIANPDLPGKKVKSIDTGMDISLDSNAKVARLIIPKAQIKQLRAELEQLDDGTDDLAETSAGDDAPAGGVTRTQTIVSGMFLSLAFVFGGIWFVRSGKAASKPGMTFMILAVLAGIGSATTYVYANMGPPAAARSITGKMFSQAVHAQGFGWGNVRLEVGNVGDRIKLIVPNPSTDRKPDGDE